ncbi:MAG: serine hydrolase domain-containing protein [Cyclobacteriaceae bacterium]
MKKFIVIIIIGCLYYPSLSQSKANFRKIQKYLDQAVEDGISGVQVYIKTPKTGVWQGTAGYADKEKKELFNKDHMSSLASVGKTYNAVALFTLVEKGKISIHHPIKKYLSESIIDNLPNGDEITVRHLLNHSSGLVNYETDSVLNALYLSGKLKLDTLSHVGALERYVFGKEPHGEPGEKHRYSSTGYMLNAMIMDELTEDGHTQYLRDLISNWGFENTYYRETPPQNGIRYYGDLDQDGVQEDITDKTLETTNWFIGDDGIYATAEEMGQFLERLWNGDILGEDALKQMMTWDDEKDPDYGQGVFPDKSFPYKFTVGHSGRGIGSTADVYYFPKQEITVAIVSNTGLRAANPKFRKAYLKMRNRIVKKLFLF